MPIALRVADVAEAKLEAAGVEFDEIIDPASVISPASAIRTATR
jgi:hypothetical protein